MSRSLILRGSFYSCWNRKRNCILPYVLQKTVWTWILIHRSVWIHCVSLLPEKSKYDTVQIRSDGWWWCIHQLYTMENDWNGQFFCHAWSSCIRKSSRKHPVAHIVELAWRRWSESVPSEHSEVSQGHTDYQRMEVFRHSAICRSPVVLQNQTISAYLWRKGNIPYEDGQYYVLSQSDQWLERYVLSYLFLLIWTIQDNRTCRIMGGIIWIIIHVYGFMNS